MAAAGPPGSVVGHESGGRRQQSGVLGGSVVGWGSQEAVVEAGGAGVSDDDFEWAGRQWRWWDFEGKKEIEQRKEKEEEKKEIRWFLIPHKFVDGVRDRRIYAVCATTHRRIYIA
jgi:hypothetical protein